MRELLDDLKTLLAARRPTAFCRLVETRGSTPQKAGATMLIYADGSQSGTLGGGCVEAEVKRRALTLIEKGTAEIADFQLDSDYGWDDGLICGGRMLVLIHPLNNDRCWQYVTELVELLQQDAGLTEVIAYDQQASGLPTPVRLLFDADQQLPASWLPIDQQLDESLLEQLKAELAPLSDRPRARARGGVAWLPALPRCRLVIVGGGHVGQAVAALASDLEFDVTVVDDRGSIVSADRFPTARERISGDIDTVLPALRIDPDTYCLIVTRGHNHDEQALYHLAERNPRYIGMIGSKRKIKMIFQDLLDQGISVAALERVHAPLGIDIGSQTVPEIAVSICAELVAHRNLDGQVPGRPAAIKVEEHVAE
jgi:xanthine dehydrogenase accessory factor